MKIKKLFTAMLLTLCACTIAGAFFLFLVFRFVTYTPASCPESAEELHNPYIGWYQIYQYDLDDAGSCDLDMIQNTEHRPGPALLEFSLKGYADRSVSDTGLQLLEQILKSWRSTGRQLIVRFLYDWDGDALDREPDSLDLIREHMSQTSGVINRYADCVYIMQGLYIGSWGEMHGSRYANPGDMAALAEHLASVTDPAIFLAVRTPEQWRLLTGLTEPPAEETARDGSLPSRLSLFNDGMMGSATDLNTYAEDTSVPDSPYGMRSRTEELAFQNLLCTRVPNGGEAVIDNPYNDFPAAVTTLSDTRVSYLNEVYDEAVLSKWKNTSYSGEGLYHGMNGYDYISTHLGYRYVIRSSACSSLPPWERVTDLTIVLENVGFSGSYRCFDLSLILKNQSDGSSYSLPFEADIRRLLPGESLTLKTPLDIRNYSAGTYDVYLKITDPRTRSQVLPANETARTADGSLIASLKISSFPH